MTFLKISAKEKTLKNWGKTNKKQGHKIYRGRERRMRPDFSLEKVKLRKWSNIFRVLKENLVSLEFYI